MLINLEKMLIFFSKRASGMLINDILINRAIFGGTKKKFFEGEKIFLGKK